jgi:hypothetical protein
MLDEPGLGDSGSSLVAPKSKDFTWILAHEVVHQRMVLLSVE